MKLYYFKDKASYNLSEYEAYNIQKDIDELFVSPKKYDYFRTKEFVIYNSNKRTRTKQNIKIRRAIALISKKENCLIKFDEKLNIAFTSKNSYIFVDKAQNREEYEYHLTKFSGLNNPTIISLTKSGICDYIELDNKTLYNYYKNKFIFVEWFRKFLKMRAIRAYSSMGFTFNTRRYNDTKWTAEDKFKHDFVKNNIDLHKIYFTLARVLDSKLDSCGRGYPLSGLLYFALDVDGKCYGAHSIDERGICVKCLKDSNHKLLKVLKIINDMSNIRLIKRLFSGTKGWHLHLEYEGNREVSENILREVINHINEDEQLVDWFDGKEIDGVRYFDLFRIMKVPETICSETACRVSEEICRLPVKDKIVKLI